MPTLEERFGQKEPPSPPSGGSAPPPTVTCPDYRPVEPGKRACVHYPGKGGCRLPTHPVCIEWEKANPELAQAMSVQLAAQATPQPPGQAEASPAFRLSTPEPKRASARTSAPPAVSVPLPVIPSVQEGMTHRTITQAEIDSWKALGVEICISTPELGEVWLVPAYTDADRNEIVPENAVFLREIMIAFPGAHAAKFIRPRGERPPTP